jgi:hypothetical protein
MANCRKFSFSNFAQEVEDRVRSLLVSDEPSGSSVTITLPPATPYRRTLAQYCPTKTGRYAGERRPVSFYGDGSDGFKDQPVSCASVLPPGQKKMNPNAMTVALRRDIYNRLKKLSGKPESIRNICGSKIVLHRPGLKDPIIATVTDLGDLGLENKKIKLMRDVDLSPAVRDKLGIKSDSGLTSDVNYVVCAK